MFLPPSITAGFAVGSAVSMALGVDMMAPHGGLFVLPLSNKPLLFILSILIGGALVLVALKPKDTAEEEAAEAL